MKAKLILLAALLAPFAAQAHDNGHSRKHSHYTAVRYAQPGPSIDQRQREQQARISHGLRSGEITRREADRLMDEQRDIRRMEASFRADGYLSASENARLHAELNDASRHIQREAHDAQQRW